MPTQHYRYPIVSLAPVRARDWDPLVFGWENPSLLGGILLGWLVVIFWVEIKAVIRAY